MEGRRELCSELSLLHDEPLSATASRVDHWLLVEYRGAWGRDVLAASLLSSAVKEHVREQLARLANSRLVFIRRPERRSRRAYAVYVVRSLVQDRRVRALECEDYEDLLSFDFAAILEAGGSRTSPEGPLMLVCTHGKRDRCCAKFGQPVYDELRTRAGSVWQSTHVGGDRFAANVVFLPEGLYFGRLQRADAAPLVDDYLAGRIPFDHYRGRSCYPFHVQAAERAVRLAAGAEGIDDLELVEAHPAGEGRSRVTFLVRESRDEHEVDVAASLGEPTRLTCAAVTPRPPRLYSAIAHRVRERR